MDHTPKKKHEDEVSVTAWLPADMAREIDAFLSTQTAGRLGVRPSRQIFTPTAIRELLDRVKAQAVAM